MISLKGETGAVGPQGTQGGSVNYFSVNNTGDVSTTSTSDTEVSGMTLSPPAGTYLVTFNTQFNSTTISDSSTTSNSTGFASTAQGVIDLLAIYNQLITYPVTATHSATLGSLVSLSSLGGETLYPGVYNIAAAAAISGRLTLDAQNNPDAKFIFYTGGVLSSVAGAEVVLINGASANNVFWIANGAISLGASTTIKGTLIAHDGVVSMADGGVLEGRMFSFVGAVNFGPGRAKIPTGNSFINFGILSNFVMFSSVGAISNTGVSDITGDVGTNVGAITGFDTTSAASIKGSIYTAGSYIYGNSNTNTSNSSASNTSTTFSIYKNNAQTEHSSRMISTNDASSIVSLQAIETVSEGQTITIRWKTNSGTSSIGNRILTLIKVN